MVRIDMNERERDKERTPSSYPQHNCYSKKTEETHLFVSRKPILHAIEAT